MDQLSRKNVIRTVSIIIPTHNRIDKLSITLESYLKQSNLLEVLIIDDASTDNTEEYFSNLENPKIQYIRNTKRLGAALSKWIGVQKSQGEYILFGEDDLYLSQNYIETLLREMTVEDADLIGGRIIYLDNEEMEEDAITRNNFNPKKLYDKYFNHKFNSKPLNNEEVIFLHGIYLVRNSIIKNVGIDANYGGNGWREETDPQITAKAQGYKIVFTPFTICFHLPRGQNLGGQHTFNRWVYEYWVYKNNLYFLKKHFKYLKQIGFIRYNPTIDNIIYISLRLYENYILKIAHKIKRLLK